MKKKLVCMLLACTMVASVTGCSKTEVQDSKPETKTEENGQVSNSTGVTAVDSSETAQVSQDALVNLSLDAAAYLLPTDDYLYYESADKTEYVVNANGEVMYSFMVKDVFDKIEDETTRNLIIERGSIEAVYQKYLIVSVFKDYEDESDLGKVYAIDMENNSCQLLKEAGDYAEYFEVVNDVLYFVGDYTEFAFQYDAASDSLVEVEDPYANFIASFEGSEVTWVELTGAFDKKYSVNGAMSRYGYVIVEKGEDFYLVKANGEEEKVNIDHRMYRLVPVNQDYVLNADDVDEDGDADDNVTLYQISTGAVDTISINHFNCIGTNENGFYFTTYQDDSYQTNYEIHYYDLASKQDTLIASVEDKGGLLYSYKMVMIEGQLFVPMPNGSDYVWTKIYADGKQNQMDETGIVLQQ